MIPKFILHNRLLSIEKITIYVHNVVLTEMGLDTGGTPPNPHGGSSQALQGLRVLDMTGSVQQYCGKMFAQLGADVTLIEPPGGCSTRRSGPFIDAIPHIERSLSFSYFNQGKNGICIDIDTAAGHAFFVDLIQQADVLIEAEPPGKMRERGLDYAALCAINPRLIMTSITPFGQAGPYSAYDANDLTVMALGGLLYMGGYPDSEPVGAPGEQAYLAAAQFAAVASLAAIWEMEASGCGQHIDVSIQECVVMALENTVQYVDLENTVRKRSGGQQRQAGTGVFPCKDGLIYLMAGGIASNRFWAATTQWLIDGGAPQADQLREPQWVDDVFLATDHAKALFAQVFLPFAALHTKAELYEEGQRRRIPVCPISTTRDLLENRQLIHRNYFCQTVHPPTGKTYMTPGAPYRLSGTPWQLGRPAPTLGEHTAQVLLEQGYDLDVQAALLHEGVTG